MASRGSTFFQKIIKNRKFEFSANYIYQSMRSWLLYNSLHLRNFSYLGCYVLWTIYSRPFIPWKWRLHVLCAKCFFYLKTATSASLKANKAISREKGPGATYLRRLWTCNSGVIARGKRWTVLEFVDEEVEKLMKRWSLAVSLVLRMSK